MRAKYEEYMGPITTSAHPAPAAPPVDPQVVQQAEKKAAAQAKIDDKANEKYQKAYNKCIKENIGNAHTQKAVLVVRKMCRHEAIRKRDSIWPW